MFSTSGCHWLDFSIHQNSSNGIFEQIVKKYCQIRKTFLTIGETVYFQYIC